MKEEAGIEVRTGNEGNEALAAAAQNLTSQLRRRDGAGADRSEATATGASLFPSKTTAAAGNASSSRTDDLLVDNRIEQEALTSSLLEMAKQLKQQSIHFKDTLEGDKSVLDRAVQGLDKSTLGMEAAGQKMGTLRQIGRAHV